MFGWIRIGDVLYNVLTEDLIPCKHPYMIFGIEGIRLLSTTDGRIYPDTFIPYNMIKEIDTTIGRLLYSNNDSL